MRGARGLIAVVAGVLLGLLLPVGCAPGEGGGSTPGTGGNGGSTTGTGGSATGTAGTTGTGGSTAGTGGSTTGTGGGGSTTGTGGSTAGAGGTASGTGGAAAGTGGSVGPTGTAGRGGSGGGAAGRGGTGGAAGRGGGGGRRLDRHRGNQRRGGRRGRRRLRQRRHRHGPRADAHHPGRHLDAGDGRGTDVPRVQLRRQRPDDVARAGGRDRRAPRRGAGRAGVDGGHRARRQPAGRRRLQDPGLHGHDGRAADRHTAADAAVLQRGAGQLRSLHVRLGRGFDRRLHRRQLLLRRRVLGLHHGPPGAHRLVLRGRRQQRRDVVSAHRARRRIHLAREEPARARAAS